jgi:hypothetical protein
MGSFPDSRPRIPSRFHPLRVEQNPEGLPGEAGWEIWMMFMGTNPPKQQSTKIQQRRSAKSGG